MELYLEDIKVFTIEEDLEKTKNKDGLKSELEDDHAFNIEEALEETKFGLFNYKIIFTCGLIMLTFYSENYSVSYVLPAAECDLNLGVNEKSILISMTFCGLVTGQFFWAYLCDTKGRKYVLVYSLLLTFVSTFLSSFAPNFESFATLRFISGLFITGYLPAAFVFLAEFTKYQVRATALTIATLFVGFSYLINPGLAWLILPLDVEISIFGYYNYSSWRLYVLFIGFFNLFSFFAVLLFPESPKFLLQLGRDQEALEVLSKIYKTNTNLNNYPVKKLKACAQENKYTGNLVKAFLTKILSIFLPVYLKSTFLLCSLLFIVFGIGVGIIMWYSEIILQLEKGIEKVTSCEALSFNNSIRLDKTSCLNLNERIYEQNLILGVTHVIGYIFMAIFTRYLGETLILVIFTSISGICGCALHWISDKILIYVLFTTFLVLPNLSITLVLNSSVDIYPTYIRGIAVSVAIFFGRMGGLVSGRIFVKLIQWNCNVTFFMYSFFVFGCIGLGLLLKKPKNIDVAKN